MYRKTKLLWIATMLAASMFSSCMKELHEGSDQNTVSDSVSSKLIFTSRNAVKGELLVYFENDAAEGIQTLTKSGVTTRSGITAFDNVLDGIGVKSIQRLFPVDPRHEERTRAAGLHRWYIVEFDESADLDAAARKMAEVAEVSKVEFNQQLMHASDGKVVPLSQSGTVTRANSYSAFNDPNLNDQWHYINTGDKSIYSKIKEGADVNCGEAWRLCTGDSRVVVAIVDNCVQWNHPDLAANMWVNEAELSGNDNADDDGNGYADDIYGYNFVDNTKLTLSVSGDAPDHGTHVAGTVAAVNNNGTGVCGVAGGSGNGDGVRIMSCQIFRDTFGGSAAMSAKAIKYAADNGAAIIQCSYGYQAGAITSDNAYASGASAEKQAIDYFIDNGAEGCDAVDGGIVIYAAGNDATGMSAYPGAYKNYISVTAMSCDYTPAYYTNYGPGCNIAAPGGDYLQSYLENRSYGSEVLSTINGGKYGYMQGTSMACPHVSGVAALALSYALELGKSFTVDQFNSILLTSVNDIDQYCTGTKYGLSASGSLLSLKLSQYSGQMGTGYIDAFKALMNVRGTTCIPVVAGTQNTIDINDYIDGGLTNVKVKSISISDEDMSRLGISSKPVIFGNKILLTCKNTGAAIVNIELQAGTSSGNGINAMPVNKEYAFVVRKAHASNGGWL